MLSVLFNIKDLYSFVLSNPVILQLKSAWICSFIGFTDSSRVHIASDKVGSLVPSTKIKYMNNIIMSPFFKCFLVSVNKINI